MIKKYTDASMFHITSNGYKINADLVSKKGQSTIVREGQDLYIIRYQDDFVMPNFELEYARRVDAVVYAAEKLSKYIQETTFVDLYLRDEDSDTLDLPVIARKVPWLDKVQSVCNLDWVELTEDREITKAIVEISLFTIKTALVKGRLYDLFRILEDIEYFRHKPDIMSLVSPNIMCGRDLDGQRVLFIDADWYITLRDGRYTGYPKYQYIRRFTQGGYSY